MDTHKDYLDKIPIRVNGVDRFATGLSKTTTIEEIKYAMLSVSEPGFRPEENASYGLFEKWHGHERLLENKSKIYKVINFWKSLPGDQLSQVKFIIKKKKHARTGLRDKENLFFVSERSDETDQSADNFDGKKLKISLIELVNKQNEFINGQLAYLSNENDRVKCDDFKQKILDAIELELAQNEKIEWLNDSLKQIDELIEMKRDFIRKFEDDVFSDDNLGKEIKILFEEPWRQDKNGEDEWKVGERTHETSEERPVVSVMSTTTSSIFTSVSSTSNTENYVVVKESAISIDETIPLETLV